MPRIDNREEFRKEVGGRLKLIARLAKKKVAELSRELGTPENPVHPNTIYRWWAGRQLPYPETLDRYVELCAASGKTKAWVLAGEGVPEQETEVHLIVKEQVADLLFKILQMTMEGANPGLAAREVLGERWISPARQEQYNVWETQMREFIARRAPASWAALNEGQRQELLNAVVQMARTRVSVEHWWMV
jgi:hypothetical protein